MLARESQINADRIRRGSRLLTRFPGRPANLGRHAFRYQSERQALALRLTLHAIIAGIIRDDLIATIGPLAHKSKENAREQAYVSSANGLFRCQLTRRQPNCPNSKPL